MMGRWFRRVRNIVLAMGHHNMAHVALDDKRATYCNVTHAKVDREMAHVAMGTRNMVLVAMILRLFWTDRTVVDPVDLYKRSAG